MTVREIFNIIGPGPGRGDNPAYNDVGCGHGPANNNGDENADRCPGRIDMGSDGCFVQGPLLIEHPALAFPTESTQVLTVEVENFEAGDGWSIATDLAGFNGSGYLIWTGEDQDFENVDPAEAGANGQTNITFSVAEAGTYRLDVRAAAIGATTNSQFNDYWLFYNGAWEKVFITVASDTWTEGGTVFDGVFQPTFELEPGTVTLQFAGRAQNFAIDNFTLVNID